MIEWIVAAAVGTPIALAVGVAIYTERRQIQAMRQGGERLGMQVIRTETRFPRLEGEIDGIPFTVYLRKEGKARNIVAQADPRGLPPEVRLTLVGVPEDQKRRRMEQSPPAERIKASAQMTSSSQAVLDALLEHDDALEALWGFHVRFPRVATEAGEVVVYLEQFTEAQELIDMVEDAAALAERLELAFEDNPIVLH
jgi:hypothetical protein